jgi:hypothetical protein
MIAISNQTARQANVDTFLERLPYRRSANAGLRRATRIDLHQHTTGAFCLVREIENEGRPRCVANAFSKHPAHQSLNVQILDRDETVFVSHGTRHFVKEVPTLIASVVVEPSQKKYCLAAAGRSFLPSRNAPLQSTQFTLCGAKVTRIINCRPITQRRESSQTNINTDCVRTKGQRLRIAIDYEQREPLTRFSLDRESFYHPNQPAMQFDFNVTDLRQPDLVSVNYMAELPERQTVVSGNGPESRIARIVGSFHSTEECFESKIDSLQSVLKDVRVYCRYVLANLFNLCNLKRLIVVGDRLTLKSPRVAAFLKCGIVKLAAESQLGVQGTRLVNARIESVSEYLNHSIVILHLKYLPA